MSSNKIIQMNPSKVGMAKGGARTVIAPKVSITYQSAEELKDKFEEYAGQGKTEIVLDLKAVPYIDSEGLEFLVLMNDELRERGGILKIISMNAVCKDIMVATRLINAMHVYLFFCRMKNR